MYLSEGTIKADGNGEIPPFVVLSEEGGFRDNFPTMMEDLYFYSLKIPETTGLGTDICFLLAREEHSRIEDGWYFRRCLRICW